MSRLTKKLLTNDYGYQPDIGKLTTCYVKSLNKLGELEDIEEELGIDLITLFNALKNGIYIYNSRKEIRYVQSVAFQNGVIIFNISGLYVELKDYGKTWALDKQTLEK